MSNLDENEVNEIFERTKSDGLKLYKTVQSLQKISEIILIAIALIGMVAGIALMEAATFIAGIVVILLTFGICYLLYILQVVAINTSKVIVNLAFINLAILKKDEK
jgi:hypothetical protein